MQANESEAGIQEQVLDLLVELRSLVIDEWNRPPPPW